MINISIATKASGNEPIFSLEARYMPNCEIKVDGHLCSFQALAGEISVVPAEHTFEAYWNQASNSVVLKLSVEFMSRNAVALWGEDQFELSPSLQIQDPFITQIALEVKQELTDSDLNRVYIETMVNLLAVYLLRKFSTQAIPKDKDKGTLSSQTLDTVLTYIDSHLEKTITVKSLAAMANLSQYHFSRAFKQSIGQSPHQYVIQQRVERAKELLSLGKMEIYDVAIACGFSSQSHFSRCFKRLTGATPKGFQLT